MTTETTNAVDMTDEALRAALMAAMTATNDAFEAAESRPRFNSSWLRRGMHDPKAMETLKLQQERWDVDHPGLYATCMSAEEHRTIIEAEHKRREDSKEHKRWAFAVLEDVPRIKAVVEKGLDDSPAHDAVREWARTSSWCLLLLGGVGCGKSTACGHYAVEVAKSGDRQPLWARAVEASRMSAFGEEAERRFAAWRSTVLLVLDDLGTELMTPTWQQALDDILDYRYQHSLRTLMPTNLSSEEFKKRYGERIADRIRHEGTVRELAGKSMRRRA